MQAELLRLKMTAEHLKNRKAKEQEHFWESGATALLGLADTAPAKKLLWKTFFLPLGWKNRILAGAALAAWKLSRLNAKR